MNKLSKYIPSYRWGYWRGCTRLIISQFDIDLKENTVVALNFYGCTIEETEVTSIRDQFNVSNLDYIPFPAFLLVKPYDSEIEDTLVLGSWRDVECTDCKFYRDFYQMTTINKREHIPYCPQCGYWEGVTLVLAEDAHSNALTEVI